MKLHGHDRSTHADVSWWQHSWSVTLWTVENTLYEAYRVGWQEKGVYKWLSFAMLGADSVWLQTTSISSTDSLPSKHNSERLNEMGLTDAMHTINAVGATEPIDRDINGRSSGLELPVISNVPNHSVIQGPLSVLLLHTLRPSEWIGLGLFMILSGAVLFLLSGAISTFYVRALMHPTRSNTVRYQT